jgi:hypothetical protein
VPCGTSLNGDRAYCVSTFVYLARFGSWSKATLLFVVKPFLRLSAYTMRMPGYHQEPINRGDDTSLSHNLVRSLIASGVGEAKGD